MTGDEYEICRLVVDSIWLRPSSTGESESPLIVVRDSTVVNPDSEWFHVAILRAKQTIPEFNWDKLAKRFVLASSLAYPLDADSLGPIGAVALYPDSAYQAHVGPGLALTHNAHPAIVTREVWDKA